MGMKIGELAWQLRSNTLQLVGGRVEPYPPMLRTATPEVMLIVLARCEAINKIIGEWEVPPATIGEVTAYFSRL